MRKIALAALCLALCAAASAQIQAFDSVVDFSVLMRDLSAAADKGIPLSSSKVVLLNGTVGSVSVLSGDGEPLKANVELIDGEWIGLEQVKMYKVVLLFRGDEYLPLFAEDEALPLVRSGARILVAGTLAGLVTDPARGGKLSAVTVGKVRLTR